MVKIRNEDFGIYIGAMDKRKIDVPEEKISHGLKKPLARERENPL